MTDTANFGMWIELLAAMVESGAAKEELQRVRASRPEPQLPADSADTAHIKTMFVWIERYTYTGRAGVCFKFHADAADQDFLQQLKQVLEANGLTVDVLMLDGVPAIGIRWSKDPSSSIGEINVRGSNTSTKPS